MACCGSGGCTEFAISFKWDSIVTRRSAMSFICELQLSCCSQRRSYSFVTFGGCERWDLGVSLKIGGTWDVQGERGIQRRGKTHARKIQSWQMQVGPVQCCAYGRSLRSLSYILVEDREHHATQYILKCSYTAFHWPVHMPVLHAGAEFNHVHRRRT